MLQHSGLGDRVFAIVLCAGISDVNERARRFVELWTLKEAYVKAVGRGISAAPGLKGFSLLLQHDPYLQQRIRHITEDPTADTAYQIRFHSESKPPEFRPSFMLCNPSEQHTAALCMPAAFGKAFLLAHESSAHTSRSTSTGSSMQLIVDALQKRPEACVPPARHSNGTSRRPVVQVYKTVPLVSVEKHVSKVIGFGTS